MLPASRAPALQNVLCDQKGVLRTNISYRKQLSSDFATPIDAVGYYYGNSPSYGAGGSGNPDDKAVFVSAGKLYYMAPTPNAPVPLSGTATLAGGLTTPFDAGVNVRFVEYDGELVCLQADGAKVPRRFDGTDVY